MRKILLVLMLLIGSNVFAQKKHALVVTVGQYPDGGRWRNLSSGNDLNYIKAALQRNGFHSIDTLADAMATKIRILAALDALYNRIGPGDIVFFHFSGHGQQIQDDNGDEPDGYDEALIPFDADGVYDPVTYTGQNHLRDDELQVKLDLIRGRIGQRGSLVVVIDACHSGTATRSNEFSICRGEPKPFQKPGYKPVASKSMHDMAGVHDGFAENGGNGFSNMIVFSASSPNQVNYETKDAANNGVGSLSYAFARALSDLPTGSDYSLLFQKVKAMIQADFPTQLPMIEGDMSQEVFSGNFVKRDEAIFINNWLNDSTFVINTGMLDNVGRGSSFAIYPIQGGDAIAEGRVIQVNVFQSVCIARGALDKSKAYQLKWTALSNGNFGASLFINTPEKNSRQVEGLRNEIADFIGNYSFLTLSDNADYMIDLVPRGSATDIRLIEKGDSTRLQMSIDRGASLNDDQRKELLENIKTAMRVKYLRSLRDGGKLAGGVTVSIIPKIPSSVPGEIFLKPLDEFSFTISNNTAARLYYTIIDIMPDNSAKVLIPEETAMPQDYVLAPGETFTIDDIQVDEGTPRGREFFKVIVSKTPLDLRSIFNRTRTRSRDEMGSFEQVLEDMFQDANDRSTTRATIGSVKIDEVGILTTGFTVSD